MAELDEISHMQGRFQALISYNFFKKLERAPAILCRLGEESEVVHHLQKASEKSD